MSILPLSPARILMLALCASIGSLGTAYIAQYGFHLHPCELCLAQRVPYALVILLAIAGLWRTGWRRGLLVVISVTFLVGGGIATYHAGVERHLVKGPSACTDSGEHPFQSLEEFINKVNHAAITACDQPQWQWHGVTMANMNAAWSLLLAVIVFAATQHIYRKEKMHA
jgi:disulfide bond formation protein DsbB